MSVHRRRIVLSAALVALSSGAVACGEEKSVSKSEVEAKAKSSIAEEVGETPKSISCPNDLDAKVGASETCVLTANDGTTINLTAEVKSIDGDNAQLVFQVANHVNE